MIRGFNKTTLLDYPGKVAATVFTGGCNFKCLFCQNSDLVFSPVSQPKIPETEIFEYINKRKGILEGICISGGEPTLEPSLTTFMKKIKETGLAVKLDTNGYRPEVVEQIIKFRLADMFAMDIKSDKAGYGRITDIDNFDFSKIEKSAELIMNSGIDYEFRTTVVKDFFNEKTAENIAFWLKGAKKYFLQKFEDSEKVIKSGLKSPGLEEMLKYKKILSETIEQVELRGVDY